MSRRAITQPGVNLFELINNYQKHKTAADKSKKVADSLNKDIKSEMVGLKLVEFVAGDIRASITSTPKEEFNEEQAIEILRTSLEPELFEKCVKTREYIDDQAFESLVFAGVIDAAILAPCTTTKEPTITLRLGKVKKGE